MRKFGCIYRTSNSYIFVVSAVQVRPKRYTVFFPSLVISSRSNLLTASGDFGVTTNVINETCNHIYRSLLFPVT